MILKGSVLIEYGDVGLEPRPPSQLFYSLFGSILMSNLCREILCLLYLLKYKARFPHPCPQSAWGKISSSYIHKQRNTMKYVVDY